MCETTNAITASVMLVQGAFADVSSGVIDRLHAVRERT
jgi:hypothetical protein